MNKPNFTQHEPSNFHTCLYCQRSVRDLDKGWVCKKGGFVLTHMEYLCPNDCEDFFSQWISDYRQHKGDGESVFEKKGGLLYNLYYEQDGQLTMEL